MKIRTLLTRSILAAAVVTSFGLGAQAFAESPQQGEEMAQLERAQKRLDRRMARMTKKLNLTPAQATKVRSILETRRASVQDAIARAGGDRKAAKPEIKTIRKASRAELKATLTADQITTMKSMRGKHGKRGKRGKRAGKKMMKSLNLSDAQRASFKVIRKDARTQRQAILASADGDRSAAKPSLKALRFETQEKIAKLLTPAQLTKFQAFQQERRAHRKARKAARQAQ